MLVLNCKVVITGERKWEITTVKNIRIERNIDTLVDWCEIEIPSKTRWDSERKCPFKYGDIIKVYLGYGEETELAFDGSILRISQINSLKLTCGDRGASTAYLKLPQTGTIIINDFKNYILEITGEKEVINDESIKINKIQIFDTSVGALLSKLYSDYNIRSGFVLRESKPMFYVGRIKNEDIKAVYDVERNVIKNEMYKYREVAQGYDLECISINRKNEQIKESGYFGIPPYKKVTYKYYNLTTKELKDEYNRLLKEFYWRNYAGTITVFGGRLVEKYDLIGIKKNGEKIGIYEVEKNVITFGTTGYRQKIWIGNEKRQG